MLRVLIGQKILILFSPLLLNLIFPLKITPYSKDICDRNPGNLEFVATLCGYLFLFFGQMLLLQHIGNKTNAPESIKRNYRNSSIIGSSLFTIFNLIAMICYARLRLISCYDKNVDSFAVNCFLIGSFSILFITDFLLLSTLT